MAVVGGLPTNSALSLLDPRACGETLSTSLFAVAAASAAILDAGANDEVLFGGC